MSWTNADILVPEFFPKLGFFADFPRTCIIKSHRDTIIVYGTTQYINVRRDWRGPWGGGGGSDPLCVVTSLRDGRAKGTGA